MRVEFDGETVTLRLPRHADDPVHLSLVEAVALRDRLTELTTDIGWDDIRAMVVAAGVYDGDAHDPGRGMSDDAVARLRQSWPAPRG